MLSTASVRLFVLDEADKLLEEGSFQEQIKYGRKHRAAISIERDKAPGWCSGYQLVHSQGKVL